jgi:hypothetical protein
VGTSSESAFGMALTLGDLVRDRESSLADGYLYRFGRFALDSRKRTLFRADSPVSLTPNQSGEAFEWLDRAYAQRDSGLIYTKVDPLLKSLHGEPRFAAFLKKLNLPN